MRRPQQDGGSRATQSASTASLPAPVGGWNVKDSLADMPPGDAVQLDNWIIRSLSAQTRLGAANHVTGLPASVVETLMPYNFAPAKLFAAVGTAFYDATVAGVAGAAVQSGLSNARWKSVNYSNSAGQYLLTVNGTDSMRVFDGTTWSTTAAFTGTAVNTNTLSDIAVYQQRLFFAENNKLSFYYLGAGAISGAGARFELGQVCRRGGRLVALASWTIDAGDGSDDHLVCVTSEGEVVVYKGTDPSLSTAWFLVGVFFVGRPLGNRCLEKFGGDLVFLTERGLFPLAKALQSSSVDRNSQLTLKIERQFNDAASVLFSNFGWSVQLHTREGFLLVNVPEAAKEQYVMDLATKAWSRFKGWDASCWAYFNGDLYFGTTSKVAKAYTGTSDFGAAITSVLVPSFNYFRAKGRVKHITAVRPVFSSTGPFSYTLALLGDFDLTVPPVTLTAAPSSSALWDSGLWDVSLWAADFVLTKEWRTVFNNPAYAFALALQMASAAVTVQFISVDYVYKYGSAIT